MMWLLYACLAALCVALSAFWIKAGSKKGDSALGAGITTLVVCIFAYLLSKESIVASNLAGIGVKPWIFMVLSGIAIGGAILCFFQATKTGEVIHVVPVQKCYVALDVLVGMLVWHSKVTPNKIIALVFIFLGMLVMIIGACGKNNKWLLSAGGTAVLLSLAEFLKDYGVAGVGAGLLRFIRLVVALIMIWLVVFTSGSGKNLRNLSFLDGIWLCFAGAAVGGSWIFLQKAMKLATDNVVWAVYRLNLLMLVILATILLKEKISGRILFGALLMIAGLEILLLKGSIWPF